jgi:hypothetical protein
MQFILDSNHFFVQLARRAARLVGLCLVLFAGGQLAAAQDLYAEALEAVARNDSQAATELLAQLVRQQPDHAGAWLDMAMLYCSAGYTQQAMPLFDAIEHRFAPPPGILELIKLQRASGCQPSTPVDVAAPSGAWRVQLGRGFESNVNQGARDLNVSLPGAAGPLELQLTPDSGAQGDGLTALDLDASLPLGGAGAQARAVWQSRRHDSLQRFDMQALTLGASQPWKTTHWRGQLEASASWMRLGDALYQRVAGVRVAAGPWQRLPAGWQADVSGGWTRTQYPTARNFDAQRVDVRGVLAYAAPGWSGHLLAGLQRDAPLAARPGGRRQGWSAEWGVRWPVAGTAVAELGASAQSWQDAQPYAPGLIDRARLQRTLSTRAALVWPAGAQGEWLLEARQVRNNENIGLFAYDALSLRLAYQWRFGQRENAKEKL